MFRFYFGFCRGTFAACWWLHSRSRCFVRLKDCWSIFGSFWLGTRLLRRPRDTKCVGTLLHLVFWFRGALVEDFCAWFFFSCSKVICWKHNDKRFITWGSICIYASCFATCRLRLDFNLPFWDNPGAAFSFSLCKFGHRFPVLSHVWLCFSSLVCRRQFWRQLRSNAYEFESLVRSCLCYVLLK